jgi:DNA-binding MarR family transcriptional regulator
VYLPELLKQGLIEQRTGDKDRRQRLLSLTSAGEALEHQLFEGMHNNMSRAYSASGEGAVNGYWTVMQNLMNEEVRDQFANFHLS